MLIADGSALTFRGCGFDAHWEFDAPLIVYAPICRYYISGSICPDAFIAKVEDICIDLCLSSEAGRDFPADWSPHDLREFEWRGWSPKRFARRRGPAHWSMEVGFSQQHGELTFSLGKVTDV